MFNFKSLIIAFVFSVSLINEAYSIMIDVRTKQEWDSGYIDGAIHIPLKVMFHLSLTQKKKFHLN